MGSFQGGIFLSSGFQLADLARSNGHAWVMVIDPINHRSLLQACDDCGVVKSVNSAIRQCNGQKGSAMISSAISYTIAKAS